MCGIAGFIDLWDTKNVRAREERARILENMCEVIRHRGPDDSGSSLKDGVALGMRRLSIIDLAGGHQPISGEDGSATIVFNGEIYNFRELQSQLESRGHVFHTRSDTEAIVHAYEEYGTACVDHLRGMFAFAIWDDREKRLFLARDRAGEKPLYYTITPTGTLVFGSELKSLLEHPAVPRQTSSESLDAYLSLGYVPDPLSIFKDIKKLSPGHFRHSATAGWRSNSIGISRTKLMDTTAGKRITWKNYVSCSMNRCGSDWFPMCLWVLFCREVLIRAPLSP
jgi:asparagine synthase (glutamine-hydrolysing)